MSEKMILCPICRTAVPDRLYYAHAKAHQAAKLRSVVGAFAWMAFCWWVRHSGWVCAV